MIKLRDYQRKALNQLYDWFQEHDGNPCIVAPTGSGKSVLIAKFVQEAIETDPSVRILMLTHQKELIEQDYEKLLNLDPFMSLGIYSASVGRRELDCNVVVAGIQSIYRHTSEVGKVDLILIDEAHLINHEDTGMYRTFIDKMTEINPLLRCIGFTATPYRLKHGMITDAPALFAQPLIEPVSIKWLQAHKYLCRLTSKATVQKLEADGVTIRGGEYVESELQKAVDVPGKNEDVVREVLKRSDGRKSWLFFCSGVDHARHVADLLSENGISVECVTGNTPKKEREDILARFKAGTLTAVTNNSVLTTGFDAPNIDMIVLMRPTMSPGLLLQMLGRGMRICDGKKDCLVLDFAGNIERHGVVTDIKPPDRVKRRKGVAPSKVCPECDEIVPSQCRTCPSCGHQFESKISESSYQLSEKDIETGNIEMLVQSWRWGIVKSRKDGTDMLVCDYYGRFNSVREFFCIYHTGWVQGKAIAKLAHLCKSANIDLDSADNEQMLLDLLNRSNHPFSVNYVIKNKYPEVQARKW